MESRKEFLRNRLLELGAVKFGEFVLTSGKKRTRGLGTGAIPQIGEEAAMEDLPAIQKLVQRADIAFVTCGLGGGTGTGSAPIVATSAKDAGSLVISIVALPFTAAAAYYLYSCPEPVGYLRDLPVFG